LGELPFLTGSKDKGEKLLGKVIIKEKAGNLSETPLWNDIEHKPI
jgi:hypothetical protein